MMETYCCARVHTSYGFSGCCKRASVERDGKRYCGTHDPVKVKERQEKRTKAYIQESEDRMKRCKFENDMVAFRDACVEAVRSIAEGNSAIPKLTCISVLKKEPKL